MLKIPREPNKDFVGRPFIWYINDCFTLVCDYYHYVMGIDFPEIAYKREYHNELCLTNLFEDYLQEFSIKEVPFQSIQNGDILVMNFNLGKRNHLGIYENGNVLHQDMLSTYTSFSLFQNRVSEIYRHESLCN